MLKKLKQEENFRRLVTNPIQRAYGSECVSDIGTDMWTDGTEIKSPCFSQLTVDQGAQMPIAALFIIP